MKRIVSLTAALVLTIAPPVVSLVAPQLLLAQPDTLWTRTYGGTDVDVGYSVAQTADGGFIVSGYTSSFGTGETDVYLIRTNSNGDTLWTETYGGIFGEIGFSLAQTSDGGFIVAGYTRSFGAGSYDVWLLKLEGFPYFQLDPYQDRVPRGGTLDFEGIYMNFADTLIKSEVVFEAYLPGGTAPQKVFSDTKNIYPGIDTLYYALSVPIAAPKKSGYLIKGKIIVPPGSGEVVSEDSFEFEVKPAMESLPFRFDWSE
jgi:hypothetical protein